MTENSWINFSDKKPPEGLYEWRIPSVSLPGEFVIVAAMMRERGTGFDKVLSPSFDHWDGYRVIVPAKLQWRATSRVGRVIHADLIGVEGLEFDPCIYCEKTPVLHGCQRGSDGRGVIICGDPWRFNSWWLDCCRWGSTPHIKDPRDIFSIRRAALERAAALLAIP